LLEDQRFDFTALDMHNNTCLHVAVSNGHVKVVSLLLGHQIIDVNAPGIGADVPLMLAVSRGNSEVLQLLLSDPRVDVHAVRRISGCGVIHKAIHAGCLKNLQRLLDDRRLQKWSEPKAMSTLLYMATYLGHWGNFKHIIDFLADRINIETISAGIHKLPRLGNFVGEKEE
jgi:ankyrin repeat protein